LEWVRALPGATDRVSVYHSQPRRENLRCPEFIVSREIPPTIQRSNFKPRCASSYTRLTVDQVGCQRWYPIILALSPAIFDRYVSALNVAGSPQARCAMEESDHRVAGCCARAASGHVTAAPPRRLMKSCRLMALRAPRSARSGP
jgi:hypothetical protein